MQAGLCGFVVAYAMALSNMIDVSKVKSQKPSERMGPVYS